MSEAQWSYTDETEEEVNCLPAIQYLEQQIERFEHGVNLRLVEIEGMKACMTGVERVDCPYFGVEKDAWLLGYLEQERHLQKDVSILLLRQAVKSQAHEISDYSRETIESGELPPQWWLPLISDEAMDAFRETPRDAILLEGIIKHALAFVTEGAVRFTQNGIEVDNVKGGLVEDLHSAVEQYLKFKNKRDVDYQEALDAVHVKSN